MRNPALFARIFNTPLLIRPDKLDAIVAGLSSRFFEAPSPSMATTLESEKTDYKLRKVGSVGLTQIIGVLAHRGGMQADSSYIMGYDRLGANLRQLAQDSDIASIVLEIDSPGGEVAGAFELAQLIRDIDKTKPVHAVVSSMAASAGYLIASAARSISISETGIAGSIGVVTSHWDISTKAAQDGIRVTYIYAGDKKVDGHPFAPLPDSVRADLQGQIDKIYQLFVRTVAANRHLSVDAVIAQQAAIYTGQDAIDQSLADRIATPDQLINELNSNTRISIMTTPTEPASLPAAAAAPDVDKIRAEAKAGGYKEGFEAGISAERERIKTILNDKSAEGRMAAAHVFALDSSLSAEETAKLLATMPIEGALLTTTSKTESAFDRHMRKLGNPAIDATGAEDAEDKNTDSAAKLVGEVVGLFKRTQGIK